MSDSLDEGGQESEAPPAADASDEKKANYAARKDPAQATIVLSVNMSLL